MVLGRRNRRRDENEGNFGEFQPGRSNEFDDEEGSDRGSGEFLEDG